MQSFVFHNVAFQGPFYDTGYPFRPWQEVEPSDIEIDDGTVHDRPFSLGKYDGGDWSGFDTDTGQEQGNLPGSDDPN